MGHWLVNRLYFSSWYQMMFLFFFSLQQRKEGMKPWLQGRLALSKQTSRFELPMDVKLLEGSCMLIMIIIQWMHVFNPEWFDSPILPWLILILFSSEMTPMEYLTKYCIIRFVAYSSQVNLVFLSTNFRVVTQPCNSQKVMKEIICCPDVDYRWKNDPLSWFTSKEIAKKRSLKTFGLDQGPYCLIVIRWTTNNWNPYQTRWYGPYMVQVWKWYDINYGPYMGSIWL